MAGSKFCPLCGDEYDGDLDMCPRDGRVLLSDREGEGSSVTLSRETEKLLGNILDEDDETIRIPRHRKRQRHSEDDEGETQVGPPPLVNEVMLGPAPGMEDEPTETTVSTAFEPVRAAALSDPLASLEGTSDDLETTMDEVYDETYVERPSSGPVRPARVFEDLQMEFDQLDTDIDQEVTQRVVREDDEKTRRSEMPPEFLEVLEQEEGIIAGEAVASDAPVPTPGPSNKVEIDESLGEELSKLEAEEAAEAAKPKRAIPRPSQLQVQKIVTRIGRPRPRRWLWAAIIALVVFVLTALILAI